MSYWEKLGEIYPEEVDMVKAYKELLEKEISNIKKLCDDVAVNSLNSGNYDKAQEMILNSKNLAKCIDGLNKCFGDEKEELNRDDKADLNKKIKNRVNVECTRSGDPQNMAVALPDIGEVRFAKPYKMSYKGKEYKVEMWRDVYLTVCAILYENHKDSFENIILNKNLQGRKVLHYSKSKDEFVRPGKITGTDIYLELNRSAEGISKLACRAMEAFNEKPEKCMISLANYVQ